MAFTRSNTLRISRVFQKLSQAEAETIWVPFADWVNAHKVYAFAGPMKVVALPAR